MRFSKYKNQLLTILLVVGFFVGILYENLISGGRETSITLFQPYVLKQYAETKIIAEEYIWYVLRLRVLPLILLCVLGMLRFRKVIIVAIVLWTGFLAGVLAVSAVICLGGKGLLLCLTGMFPHMIFYGLAYGMVVVYLYQHPEKQWNIAKTSFVFFAVFVGVFLESYVNPMLLQWFASRFV